MLSNMSDKPQITLFHYPFSPWSQKITAYLSIRGIPYISCEQPVTLPRPDLTKGLGVKYRRIPVMSIGRDVYCDTLLMLEKLEELYPYQSGEISRRGKNGTERALEKLLEKWTDVVVFKYAAAAIPTNLDLMKDKNFQEDRKNLWGRDWTKEHQDSLRAEAVAVLRSNMEFLENDVLEDGRDWILGGRDMTLGDIHAGWIFVWLAFDIPGSMEEHLFNKEKYPRSFKWFENFRGGRKEAMEKMEKEGKVTNLDGQEAIKKMLSGGFGEKEGSVDEKDPSGLKKGDLVEGWPTDTGFEYHDVGTLVGLTTQEAVLSSKAQDGSEIRVHHPRWQFAVEKSKGRSNGA